MQRFISCLLHVLAHQMALPLLIILMAGLRVGYTLVVTPPPTADFLEYHRLATELAAGNGYIWEDGTPAAFRPVGYPAVLAGVYTIAGPSIGAGQALNTLMGMMSVWLAFLLARRILRDEIAARMVLLILAIHPNGIAYGALLASEPLSLCLLLAGMLLWHQMLSRTDKFDGGRVVLAGLLFAACALVKPQFLAFPAFLTLLPKSWQPGRRRRPVISLLVHVAMVMAILPWMYRNYTQLGVIAPVSTNGGYNFFVGNSRFANGRYYWGDEVEQYLAEHAPVDQMSIPSWSSRLGDMAWDDVKAAPFQALVRLPVKVFFLYAADFDGIRWTFLSYPETSLAQKIGFYSLMSLAQCWYLMVWLPILFWVIKQRFVFSLPSGWLILLAPALFTTLVSMVFFGASRFHFSFLPFLVILGTGILLKVRDNLPN